MKLKSFLLVTLLYTSYAFTLPSYPPGYFDFTQEMDPQSKALMEELNGYIASIRDMNIQEARDLASNIPQNPPKEGIKKIDQKEISGPNGPIGLRIYTPEGGSSPLPILLYIHGGGWVFGSANEYDEMCQELCVQSQFLVVSVDYNLAPEHPFPEPLQDCYTAAKWVYDNSADLGGDSQKMAVAGDSAGGNLSAALVLMLQDQGTPFFKHQVLICPALNYNCDTLSSYEFTEGFFLAKDDLNFFWNLYLRSPEDGLNPLASPLKVKSLKNLPSASVIIADVDTLRDEALAYALRLHRSGVDTTVKRYPSFHGFYAHVDLDIGRACLAYIAAQLQEHFR